VVQLQLSQAQKSELAAKICHVLSVYPQISPSMLQIALNIPANSWRPVLEELIAQGSVKRRHEVAPTPTGRHQTYTILSLASDGTTHNANVRAAE
jgi:hypothetical protein